MDILPVLEQLLNAPKTGNRFGLIQEHLVLLYVRIVLLEHKSYHVVAQTLLQHLDVPVVQVLLLQCVHLLLKRLLVHVTNHHAQRLPGSLPYLDNSLVRHVLVEPDQVLARDRK